jgi:UDP-N-acetylmuramate dehydrogenase
MDKIKIYNKLTEIISKDAVLLDEPMKNHTSIRVGGTADIMATPRTIAEIQSTIKICKENNTPYFIMGNGSNLIVRDKGMRCVVIKLGDRFANVDIDGNTVVAQAGVLLSTLSEKIMAENLTGFEFANGIPGTLGGAVAMNAGAYGGEMQDVVRSVKVLSPEGKTKNLLSEELEFGYRTSAIQTRNYIVLEVEMEFEKGDYDKIVATTKELIEKRTMKQPLNLPSCGSVFKRPVGHFFLL